MAFTVLSTPVEATTHHRSTVGTTEGSLALAIARAAAFGADAVAGQGVRPGVGRRVQGVVQRLAGQRLLREVDGERRAGEEDDHEQRDQDGDGAVLGAVPDPPGAHSILIRLVLDEA